MRKEGRGNKPSTGTVSFVLTISHEYVCSPLFVSIYFNIQEEYSDRLQIQRAKGKKKARCGARTRNLLIDLIKIKSQMLYRLS